MNRFSNRSILTLIGTIIAFGIGYQVGNMINSSVTYAQNIKKLSTQLDRRTAGTATDLDSVAGPIVTPEVP